MTQHKRSKGLRPLATCAVFAACSCWFPWLYGLEVHAQYLVHLSKCAQPQGKLRKTQGLDITTGGWKHVGTYSTSYAILPEHSAWCPHTAAESDLQWRRLLPSHMDLWFRGRLRADSEFSINVIPPSPVYQSLLSSPSKRIPDATHSKNLRRDSPAPIGLSDVPMAFSTSSSRGYVEMRAQGTCMMQTINHFYRQSCQEVACWHQVVPSPILRVATT